MSKPYGLIIPGQQKKEAARPAKPPIKPSVFDESSDSDDSKNAPQMRPKAGVTGGPSVMERRVARRMQEKALAEDPTIFQYDELYDEMENKRDEAKQSKSQEPRKAKYINRLMEHAERRKLEKELRVERQVQKDREAEGEMYKDKDTYVTAAYRKRLESMRELQEKEQRADYLEAIGDVTKQKDLDGFYRHLYEQKLGTTEAEGAKPKTAPSTEEVAYKPIKADVPKHRSYRKRRASEDEENQPSASPAKPTTIPDSADNKPGNAASSLAHLNNNIDADSDFSIDDSSEDEVEDEKEKNMKQAQAKKQTKKETKSEQSNSQDPAKKRKTEQPEKPEDVSKEAMADPKSKSKDDNGDKKDADVKNLPIPTVTKPTVDRTLIWRKRTVGKVLEAALARYQVRKKSRQG
ncbi:nuclear speckle splicing regulatory protein 1 [Drosophila madeirensis]|uniref:Nuclear speckle splicing regulatory protein 1 n=1 Tax=Drosophila madeirensis TaxID=30013 RepID=A0AAU9G3S6_DROMD